MYHSESVKNTTKNTHHSLNLPHSWSHNHIYTHVCMHTRTHTQHTHGNLALVFRSTCKKVLLPDEIWRTKNERGVGVGGLWLNGSHLLMHVFTYLFVMPSILQYQFIATGFMKTDNFEHSVVLLLFSFTLEVEEQLMQWGSLFQVPPPPPNFHQLPVTPLHPPPPPPCPPYPLVPKCPGKCCHLLHVLKWTQSVTVSDIAMRAELASGPKLDSLRLWDLQNPGVVVAYKLMLLGLQTISWYRFLVSTCVVWDYGHGSSICMVINVS